MYWLKSEFCSTLGYEIFLVSSARKRFLSFSRNLKRVFLMANLKIKETEMTLKKIFTKSD